MKWFKIRLNTNQVDTVVRFLNGYKEPYNAYIFVLHTHTQNGRFEHIHGVFQSILGKDTIRKSITKLTELDGSDYCLQTLKEDTDEDLRKAIQYMFHHKHGNTPRQLLLEGIKESLLAECIEAAREISDDFEERKKKKKSDSKKEQITSKKIMLDIIEECRPGITDGIPSPYYVMKKLIDKYILNKMRLPTSMDTLLLTIYANWGYTDFVLKCYRSNVLHVYDFEYTYSQKEMFSHRDT